MCIGLGPVPRLLIYLGELVIRVLAEVFEGCHMKGCAYERPLLYFGIC